MARKWHVQPRKNSFCMFLTCIWVYRCGPPVWRAPYANFLPLLFPSCVGPVLICQTAFFLLNELFKMIFVVSVCCWWIISTLDVWINAGFIFISERRFWSHRSASCSSLSLSGFFGNFWNCSITAAHIICQRSLYRHYPSLCNLAQMHPLFLTM